MTGHSQTINNADFSLTETKSCVACQKEIHKDAKVCPYCRSAQKKKDFHQLAVIVKWVGGITAFFSLGIGAIRVSEFYESWREENQIVTELVAAADLQFRAKEYPESWDTIQSALKLNPGSLKVRDKQVELALHWIRHVDWSEVSATPDSEIFERVNTLLPVLYRGAATSEGKEKAMVLAHIAWAQVVLYRVEKERNAIASRNNKKKKVTFDEHKERLRKLATNVEKNLKQSLSIDPGNVVGNVVSGYWQLAQDTSAWHAHNTKEKDNDKYIVTKAVNYFDPAFKDGKYPEFVNKLILRSLNNLNTSAYTEARTVYYANQIRQRGEELEWWISKPLKWVFYNFGKEISASLDPEKEKLGEVHEALDETLAIISPEELVKTFIWGEAPNRVTTISSVNIGASTDSGIRKTRGTGITFLQRVTKKMEYSQASQVFSILRQQHPDAEYLPTEDQLALFFGKKKPAESTVESAVDSTSMKN